VLSGFSLTTFGLSIVLTAPPLYISIAVTIVRWPASQSLWRCISQSLCITQSVVARLNHSYSLTFQSSLCFCWPTPWTTTVLSLIEFGVDMFSCATCVQIPAPSHHQLIRISLLINADSGNEGICPSTVVEKGEAKFNLLLKKSKRRWCLLRLKWKSSPVLRLIDRTYQTRLVLIEATRLIN